MKLRIIPFGLAVGIWWGLAMFVTTLWLGYMGIEPQPAVVTRFGLDHLGYSISFAGAIVGLILGSVDGFVDGVIIAFFYNVTAEWCTSGNQEEERQR